MLWSTELIGNHAGDLQHTENADDISPMVKRGSDILLPRDLTADRMCETAKQWGVLTGRQ